MRLATWLAAGITAALGACTPEQRQAAAPDMAGAPAPAGPSAYAAKTETSEVSLTVPERAAEFPTLYAKVFTEERAALDAFAARAAKDVPEMVEAGAPGRQYTQKVDYSLTVETQRLVSLRRLAFEDTGGAHPNTALTALTWDKAANRPLETSDLLAPDADLGPADQTLCAAIKAEKRRRTGDDGFSVTFPACPRLVDVRTVLTPSSAPGKAAGLTALFSPYDIGPYVEGAYEIILPYPAIQSVLNPDYAGEFAGEPQAPKATGG